VYNSSASTALISSIIDPSMFTPIHVPPDGTQAILVLFQSSILQLSKPINSVSSNSELQITRGQPVDSDYNVGREFLLFQGSIHYYFTGEPSCEISSAAPSNAPSVSPTDYPTSFPTQLTNYPSLKASNLPTLMPSTSKPTFFDSLMPSETPSLSPSSSPTFAPTKFELGKFIVT
jgi:hypothetical protein